MRFLERLARLAAPMLQAALLVIPGLILLLGRRFRLAGALMALAVAWMWLCSSPAFALWLNRGLEGRYPPASASSYPKVDAIVVLGGGRLPPDDIDWDAEGVDHRPTRLGFGLELFQKSRADILLLSGAGESLEMAERLREQGVPTNALITENASTNTYQNALYSARLLKQHKLQRILLVTTSRHMPRAVACFTRQGLTVIAAPVPHRERSRRLNASWWPKRGAFYLTIYSLRENVALWIYRLLGRA
jgi:uncharacterized SAM-binding protein YcdF (DUF218 family)